MKIARIRWILASGPLRGTAGREIFFKFFLVSNPPRGRPFGGGGNHHKREESGDNLRIIADYYDFHGKCSITG